MHCAGVARVHVSGKITTQNPGDCKAGCPGVSEKCIVLCEETLKVKYPGVG